MSSLLRDLRYSWRNLRKSPAFFAVAVLTIALGIGANTAIFSVVDGVLLEPLPYKDPGRLVSLRERSPSFPSMSVSLPDYYDWRQQAHAFEVMGAYGSDVLNLTGVGEPEVINAEDVTANIFPMLGAKPLLGHIFVQADDQPGSPGVVILSYTLWHRRFGGDPSWVGKSITLAGERFTIIGVMPAGFSFGDRRELWMPLGPARGDAHMMSREGHYGLEVIARLKPGVTLERAQHEMDLIANRLAAEYPKTNSGIGITVRPFKDWILRHAGSSALMALLAAVGLVLLIACVNLANLMLSRATGRQREFSVRMALGAGRGRIIRESLTESLLLAAVGGVAAIGVASVCVSAAPSIIPPDVPRAASIGINSHVLLFAIAATVLTGLAFGFLPAWQAGMRATHDALKESARSVTTSAGGQRLRNALVINEVALALVLLAGSVLLLRSFVALMRVDPGFAPEHTLSLQIAINPSQYKTPVQQLQFFQQTLARVQAIPGVAAAGTMSPLPFSGNDWEEKFAPPADPSLPRDRWPSTNMATVTPGSFRALGLRLLRGRAFTVADDANAPKVAIIDDVFARRYWSGKDPVGSVVDLGDERVQVVGVVGHVLFHSLNEAEISRYLPTIDCFEPFAQHAVNFASIAVRADASIADPLSLTQAIKNAVHALDHNQPVFGVETMQQRLGESVAGRRLLLLLSGGFAALALSLAALGIFGVLSYAVTQRSHEIGIRMAVGAQAADVLRLVIGQGLRVVALGVLIGAAVSLLAGRAISAYLFGTSAHDPITLIISAAVLAAVALLACYLPASRAARVDPLQVLRAE